MSTGAFAPEPARIDSPLSRLRALGGFAVGVIVLGPIVALAFLLGIAGLAAAEPSTPPPLEAYGRLPGVEMVQMAPSGRQVAYVAVTGDARQLVVRDMQGTIRLSAALGDQKVRSIEWAGDDHLVIEESLTSSVFLQNDEFWEALVLSVDGTRHFSVFKGHPEILPAIFGYEGAVAKDGHWYAYFIGFPLSKTRGFDPTINSGAVNQLYRVDLDGGEVDVVGRAYDLPRKWAIGPDGVVAAWSEYNEKAGVWTLHSGASGETLATLKDPLGLLELVGLGPTPGTVVVHESVPETFSLADGGHAPLLKDEPSGDVQYLFDPTSRHLLGLQFAGDEAGQVFLEPELAAKLASLSKAFGGQTQITSWSADFKRLIVYTVRDGDPGTYWLVDGLSAKAFGDTYPEVPDAFVATTRVVDYKAADGLDIHGVLTLPPGRDARRLPLVVMPHGGPEAHDMLGFDWWAQAFASRGYAVFQPNFRGSNGYGIPFRDAGFGEWGRKMQSDISDGVDELAREGVADRKRVCVVGASYGGYAALAGVTLQQGLYRCAVSYAGISDLTAFLNTAIPGDDDRSAGARYLRKFTGSKSNGDRAMAALSPARLAAKADAPILLIHGSDDSVVEVEQSQEMARSLKAAGKPVDFILVTGEDHWLSRDATRKAVLIASVAFVEKYNPAQ